ncbi:DUF1513 domain-containing protein [Sinirhodobacter populi]|uniref:DUF1513 domain-containing protein n=1 Tax=Paenirhodobacter populi TaxID=2306993 RepID=A0A443K0R1_9RHOB|nr:DUF1513 domain-containing protein [Sinirhodobacter populi]RWR26305.1 DUF1513 domain-containing protein [Sinirhodobacter populi]
MTSRRAFLTSLIVAGALPRLTWADAGSPVLLAAGRDRDGNHWLHGLSREGESRFSRRLPGRGHAAAAHPIRPEAVAFARRPGTFAVVIDCLSGAALAHLTPPAGRQFNGHGAFSADGGILYTSEVIADGSDGRIGVWDAAAGYARIREWSSGGIGPHEILRLPDGGLAVANGGIETDPQDRSKLNIGTMRPNLTLLAADGSIREQVSLAPEYAMLSIRHLALAPDGELAFAMQWEGDPAEIVPLLGLYRPGGKVRLCPAGEVEAFTMRGYAGSVAFSGPGDMVAITSPVGGAIMVFDLDGRPLATHGRPDICGLAPAAHGFMATDGAGMVWACDNEGMRLLTRVEHAWDNHLVPVAT